jgi:signal transduction histidine kinase
MGSEPYLTLAIAGAGRRPGVTMAEANLKLIWDVITSMRIGLGGYAYVVDRQGRLIAHPDMSLVLRGTSLASVPQVAQGLRELDTGRPNQGSLEAEPGFDGRRVLSAHAALPTLGWLVFVELPVAEALEPLIASALRTVLVLAAGLVLATLAAWFVVHRMTGPIALLEAGAARIGAGDLDAHIEVRTGDELETVANQFNSMAAQLKQSYAGLERKVEERTRELSQLVGELQALEEVLRAVNSSLDLQTVLFTIISRAVQLSQADEGTIYEFDSIEQVFVPKTAVGMTEDLVARLRERRIRLGETYLGRSANERRPIHVDDVQVDESTPEAREYLPGIHALLAVPLLREDEVIGGMVIRRRSEGAFAANTVTLLQTFAGQSVLAIENARLFQEAERARAAAEAALNDLRRAQDRLVQSEKMASLGQLTAGIAHEIKNPLNFVNNFSVLSAELIDELRTVLANTAIDGPTRAEVEELGTMIKGNLEKVVQHGKRADGIVKNMLLHARESGGERRSVNLNVAIEEALNLAYHGARAEKPGFNIKLERQFDPALGALEIYPQEFTRVILNVIANGFYAASRKALEGASTDFQPTLTVATEAHPEEVLIRVRDNGTGIPDSAKARLFEPFFTTKPPGEGTGLGLSLSHDIVVKQHGGSIAADSRLGEYTEFTITLPRPTVGGST